MHHLVLPVAFVALASQAAAGVAETWAPADVLSFVDGDWEDKCEGEVVPIKWSKGNGKDVKVTVKGSDGWEEEICADEDGQGGLEWEVDVPKCDCEYSIWLQQEDCEELESPKFTVHCAAEEEPDHDGWNKPTGSAPAAPSASSDGWKKPADASATDGWKKPADASATDGWNKPVAPASASSASSDDSWKKPVAPATGSPAQPVAPAATSPAKPVAPATGAASSPVAPAHAEPSSKVDAYTGSATKIGGSVFALAAVFAVALAL